MVGLLRKFPNYSIRRVESTLPEGLISGLMLDSSALQISSNRKEIVLLCGSRLPAFLAISKSSQAFCCLVVGLTT